MTSFSEMTRDEFLYEQVKGDCLMHRVLAVVYGACTVAALVLGVLGITQMGLEALLGGITLAASTFGPAYLSWGEYKERASALEEIGDDPTGIDAYKYYSATTAGVIAESRLSKKEYFQQWVGYGIIALSLLILGGLLLALGLYSHSEMLLIVIGSLMVAGGFLLAFLTVKSFRSWLIAKRFEKLDEQNTMMQ